METGNLQKSYISGSYADSSYGETFVNYSPGTGQKICDVQVASPEDIETAVQSAKTAFATWSQTRGAVRSRILWKAAELIRKQAESLACPES